MLILHENLGS